LGYIAEPFWFGSGRRTPPVSSTGRSIGDAGTTADPELRGLSSGLRLVRARVEAMPGN